MIKQIIKSFMNIYNQNKIYYNKLYSKIQENFENKYLKKI